MASTCYSPKRTTRARPGLRTARQLSASFVSSLPQCNCRKQETWTTPSRSQMFQKITAVPCGEEKLALYRKRQREGYDLPDPEYLSWLHGQGVHHKSWSQWSVSTVKTQTSSYFVDYQWTDHVYTYFTIYLQCQVHSHPWNHTAHFFPVLFFTEVIEKITVSYSLWIVFMSVIKPTRKQLSEFALSQGLVC